MADLAQLEAALIKADAAGDEQGARILAAEIRKMRSSPEPVKEAPVAPQEAVEPSMATKAKDVVLRTTLGAAEPVMAFGQAMAHQIPELSVDIGKGRKLTIGKDAGAKSDEAIKTIEAVKKNSREQAGSEGMDVAGLVGGLLTGGKVYKGVMKDIPEAVTKAGKVLQGSAVGAAFGGAQTVKEGDFDTEKLSQIGTGAVIGALIPGGVEIAKGASRVVKSLLQPLSEAGRAKILKDYLDTLVGPAKQKVIDALKNAPEYVKGSKPTAGEAVADMPEATALTAYQAALEKATGRLTKDNLPISAKFASRKAEQEGARKAAIETVSKTKGDLEQAIGERTAQSMRDYGAAYSKAIKVDPKLAQMSTNPYFKDALPDAVKLAEARGVDSKTDLTQFLHFVKLSLDKQLTKNGDTALSTTERQQVQKLQKELVGWMGSKNPLYEQARANFAEASKPINQMQVGQYLKDKMINALDDERAGVFAQAVRDAPTTIKKSSGQARFDDLGQVLTKDQKSTIDGILSDLKRNADYRKSARETSLQGAGGLAEKGVALPAMLDRAATVTNYVLKTLRHGSDDKINAMAADLLLKPEKLAAFMETVPATERSAVVKAFMQRVSPENRAALSKALTIGAPVSAATD